jgi:hypothetical protein
MLLFPFERLKSFKAGQYLKPASDNLSTVFYGNTLAPVHVPKRFH